MVGPRPGLRRDTQETRDRLLVAFGELLAESGPTFGLPELARRGGVATATAYRHFETIHDAHHEFLLQLTDRLTDRLTGRLQSVPPTWTPRRRFDAACERWAEQAADWGPAAVHIRSWRGFLERVHLGDEPTGALYAALEPIVRDLIDQGELPDQDVEYAVLVWITMFDERVIVDLRESKGWPVQRLARVLGRSVLSALGGTPT
ncbi:TetR/AcrR family transcriptional regulator [Candidatus Frankia alpina]|uniref:TetR/AcrR family transcriptional regulator n=1 Tax=Candidatus Frankia alpina TaxID=2699483 RepID=A0A4S5CDS8_9ACTN|nr:TetR/AcrR family transcriptional regulator [Candidatus Frankia alpina]THJ41168.1 TetR/AcrR family transcriptional regulator [Candidatus Frankia alpina]